MFVGYEEKAWADGEGGRRATLNSYPHCLIAFITKLNCRKNIFLGELIFWTHSGPEEDLIFNIAVSQYSYKVRIITAGMSHGNGPLPRDLAWPWPRGNCILLLGGGSQSQPTTQPPSCRISCANSSCVFSGRFFVCINLYVSFIFVHILPIQCIS